jgi:hypothetical protein
MLAYLNRGKGFDAVRQALTEAQISGGYILMNQINVGETYYTYPHSSQNLRMIWHRIDI